MSEVHALVSYTGSPGIEILTGAGEGELTPHVFSWEGGWGGGWGQYFIRQKQELGCSLISH